jgi:hypothetical protein
VTVVTVNSKDVEALSKLPTAMLRGFAQAGSLAAKAVLAMREAGRGN